MKFFLTFCFVPKHVGMNKGFSFNLMPNSHCNPWSFHCDMQWKSCLACSQLHFGYLVGVPENMQWLFSLSLSWLACMPGTLDT